MRYIKYLIYSVTLSIAFSQFGQNSVQYKDFQWRFIQSKHFDIYFYEGGETIAEFTAEIAEDSYEKISRNWNYTLNRRIPMFIYSSHNDFKSQVIYEGGGELVQNIGGVTELFKNRIYLPYEGSYKAFRHVIHHEVTHSIMNDMLYGGSIQSLISSRVSQVPLWFAEGLAEWEATGWDTKLDMAVRDIVINNVPLNLFTLNFISPYQGGSNLFKYISLRFGREKVREILHKVRGTFGFYSALESAVGLKPEKLSEDWLDFLKKEYWPEIVNKERAESIATALTDHKEEGTYINFSPSLSPNGDKIAFISDEDGYYSLYVKNTFDGKNQRKLIQGRTSNKFEELNFLSPGMSWSRDGKLIAFSAKGGEDSYLYLVDVESEDVEGFTFDLDGVFDGAFSPTEDKIAFVGHQNGESDIYVYDLKTKDLTNITNDVFSDKDPSWSADGKRIVFTSDRRDHLNDHLQNFEIKMHQYDYSQTDIYLYDFNNKLISRITETEADEGTPVFSPKGDIIAFTSDLNGISNIYFKNIDTNEEAYPVSNLLTGAYQLDWSKDGKQMVFVSFYNSGWDIYNIKNPLDLEAVTLEPTKFINNRDNTVFETLDSDNVQEVAENSGTRDYSTFNFSRLRYNTSQRETLAEKASRKVKLDDSEIKKDGKYLVRDYEYKWSMDFVTAQASYDNIYGINGFYTLYLSDLSGANKISINTNFVLNFRNTDISIQYAFVPKRINYYVGLYHLSNNFTSNFSLYNYRNYGVGVTASRPFSQYNRLDLSTSFMNFELTNLDFGLEPQSSSTILTSLSYIHDNTQWYYGGPIDGSRYSITASIAPKYSSDNLAFTTLKVDFRNYIRFGGRFSFVTRFSAGSSYGLRERADGSRSGQQTFRLGGVDFWLFNTKYKTNDSNSQSSDPDINGVDEISFSEWVTPLRGAYYNERNGRNYALMNFELRFPFIDYLIMTVPPLPLQGIRGAIFYDIGSAFDSFKNFRGFKNGKPEDLVIGFGYGIQAYLPFIGSIFRFDTAWRNVDGGITKPIYYFSFGYDF